MNYLTGNPFDDWKLYLNLLKKKLNLGSLGNLLQLRDISQIQNGTIFWSSKIQVSENLMFYNSIDR